MNCQENAETANGNHELPSVIAEEHVPVKLQLNFSPPFPCFSSESDTGVVLH